MPHKTKRTKRREKTLSEREQLQHATKFDKRGKRQRTRKTEVDAYREEFTD